MFRHDFRHDVVIDPGSMGGRALLAGTCACQHMSCIVAGEEGCVVDTYVGGTLRA